MGETVLLAGSAIIVLLVLILPLAVHKVEENLEIFLFIMGVAAATLAQVWSGHLVWEAVREPLPISIAVIALGCLSKFFSKQRNYGVLRITHKIGFKPMLFLIILFLSLTSSIITAIVAAIILSELVATLGVQGEDKVKFVVLACFAIGMGAVFTPIGEPLSTIAVSKLKGPPHHADFFFLLELLGPWMIPGIIVLAAMVFGLKQKRIHITKKAERSNESYGSLIFRGVKVYFFVAALVFLGEGLKPLATRTILKLSDSFLYWANSISAILDNATLAAIEIVPTMSSHTILFLLTGLILAGGLLIPGNIPNIICASKLNIGSKSWAKYAIPLGVALMVIYFVLLKLFAGNVH
ncbi:putative cation transporter [Parelusimicrobium proximum]|uniref:DUF1646 family protein n=1 Tax=Parelusimicrobium proximum TaxID=3228953 RepID=UPI003D168820